MKIVLTGGPHAGKTALARELARRGVRTVAEAAIDVIAELVGVLGPDAARAWRVANPREFQARIARLQIEREAALDARDPAPCFLDRGLFDGLAYCRAGGVEAPGELAAALAGARYDLAVSCELVLPFSQRADTGRITDLDRARRIEALMEQIYAERGVPLLRLPAIAPVEARAERLLAELKLVPARA
jgi:predicted ATPase